MNQFTEITAGQGITTGYYEKSSVLKKRPSFLTLHLNQNRVRFLWVVIFDLINSCSNFFLTLIIGDFFIIQFNSNSSKGKLLHKMGIDITGTGEFFLLFLLLLAIKITSGYIAKMQAIKQGELFVKTIREQLFAYQLNSDAEIFRKKSFGNYLLRYSNDMKAIQNLLTKGILGAVKELIFLMVGLLLIGMISAALSLIITGSIMGAVFAVRKITAYQNVFITGSRNMRSNLLAFVTKTFSRFNIIKQEENQNKFIQRFNDKSRELLAANLKNERIESLLNVIAGIVPFTIIGGVLLMISSGIVPVSASNGLLVILMMLLMQGTVRRLLRIPGYLVKGKISLGKIEELMA